MGVWSGDDQFHAYVAFDLYTTIKININIRKIRPDLLCV